MTEHALPHESLTGYLLGELAPGELARFEAHVAACATCADEVHELEDVPLRLVRAVPATELPPGLESRTFAAIERAAVPERPTRRQVWRRPALALVAAAVLAAGILGATQLAGGRAAPELEAVLAPPAGGPARATVRVEKTGIGRVIAFRTDDLPILPKGDYYELWFVGAGDAPGRPKRISAGTFHPDEDGRSHASFTAAVDPARYPVLSVTAEPGDGNPARTGPEVLRSRPGSAAE